MIHESNSTNNFLAKHGLTTIPHFNGSNHLPYSFTNESHERSITDINLENHTKLTEPTDEELAAQEEEYKEIESFEEQPYDSPSEFAEDFHLEAELEKDDVNPEFPKKFFGPGIYSIIGGTKILYGNASKKAVKEFCTENKNFAIAFCNYYICFYLSLMPVRINIKNILVDNEEDMEDIDKLQSANAYIVKEQPTKNLLIIPN